MRTARSSSHQGVYLVLGGVPGPGLCVLRGVYCNSMPFGAAWAYYGIVPVLASAASWNGRVCSEVK